MIKSLTITNIALIEKLTILFHRGMHVLAGETGAGKSIVVDSVKLILGGRADRDLIRNGYDKASVEAAFDISGVESANRILERESIDYDEQNVTLYREISRNGKNVCRLCGVIVPLATIRQLSAVLLDIHGQHEYTMLEDNAVQLSFLDSTGDSEHRSLLDSVTSACNVFMNNHRQYSQLYRESQKNKHRLIEVEESLKELHEAGLKPGEQEELRRELTIFHASHKINEALRSSYGLINQTDGDLTMMGRANQIFVNMSEIAGAGKQYEELATRCQNLYYDLQELSYDIIHALEENEFNPEKMHRKEDRMDLIKKLEKKYGTSIPEVLNKQRELEREYEQLASMDDRLIEMRSEHKKLLSEYRLLSRKLSESRKKLASEFEKNLLEELKLLGMPNTVFSVSFYDKNSEKPTLPSSTGDDDICFMLSPNPGEPLKPMGKIASGGELSRIMLAIKSLEAEHHGTGTMVFDEIDTGISGKMAQIVAEKMKKISNNRQVICVSHLPQIFATADFHYLVEKKVMNDRTFTEVNEQDDEGSVSFLAKMIGGTGSTEQGALKYAEKMIHST